MNFTTPTFLLYFLPFVLIIYFIFPKFRNFTLILASGLFYFWGEGKYLLLIYFWVISNFITGKLIYSASLKHGIKRKIPKIYLILSIIINLSVLIYFKYVSFLLSNLSILGISTDVRIYLPLAISFFTFHAILYNVDVFRGITKPESSLSRLILYFTFFPHLIAGPIIRYHQIYNQLYRRVVDSDQIAQGIYRFVRGLAKKLVISNTIAPVVNEIFAIGPSHLTTDQVWLGAILFALQIFYDFSGYTDMAIGLGMIFGFTFPENFNYPYIATSVTDFWRRWHMTLSYWLRDYLYIPLGGSRKGKLRTYQNLLIVFLLGGLWHGANWTFLIWGLFHGAFLVVEKIKDGILMNWMPKIVRHLYMIFFLSISWVFFRSTNLTEAFGFIKVMLGIPNNQLIYFPTNYFLRNGIVVVIVLGIIFATPLPEILVDYMKKMTNRFLISSSDINLVIYNTSNLVLFVFLFILSLIHVAGPTYQSFIYFRF